MATECYEVRGKTLGIVGYGHIGSQVGVLAEMMGMRVSYYKKEKNDSIARAQNICYCTSTIGVSYGCTHTCGINDASRKPNIESTP